MAVTITLWVLLIGLIGAFIWLRRQNGGGDTPAAPQPNRPSTPEPAVAAKTPEASPPNAATTNLQQDADSLFAGAAPAPSKPDSEPAAEPVAAPQEAAPEARPGAKRHWMVGVTKDIKDKRFHVGQQTATIGRLPNNLIQIDSGNASRVHCQLRGSAQRLQVMPMDAKNGTRINGELAEPHTLHPLTEGDVLEIGNSVLVYHEYIDRDPGQTEIKKQRGISVEAATALVGGEAWSERLRNQLRAHGGDIGETARAMGIEPDVLEHMISQLGMDK